jgi:hypothetical protein
MVYGVLFDQFGGRLLDSGFWRFFLLPPTRDSVVEVFPALNLIGFILLFFELHVLEHLLILFFGDIFAGVFLGPHLDRLGH